MIYVHMIVKVVYCRGPSWTKCASMLHTREECCAMANTGNPASVAVQLYLAEVNLHI